MFYPEQYTIVAHWLPRLLGLIYFFSFGALIFQIKGLIGSNGILPITDYFNRAEAFYPKRCYYYLPSVFWIDRSDRALLAVTVAGTLISCLLMAGIYPPVMIVLLYILYLSIVSAGQDFLAFGWEGLLLETTAHVFLISLTPVPVLLVWISINFLLFRFHLMAGLVKLQSRDRSWHDLTAIAFHYQTQPIPNFTAWLAHKLPMWIQKSSVLVTFFIEIIAPFGIFAGEEVRLLVFAAFFSLQFFIWFTGNFSFLNHLTVVLCTILIANSYLSEWLVTPTITEITPIPMQIAIAFGGAFLLFIQLVRLYHQFIPNQLFTSILSHFAPFYLANRYGIFAVMTTIRYEIVIEGSTDGITWKEYTFKHKPSELNRRPSRISPFQPRLDWQIWFTPFVGYTTGGWFHSFLIHLLKGTPEVLALIRHNPFQDEPPHYIVAKVYVYEFTTFEERKKTGNWWKRRFFNNYTPTLSQKTH